MFRICSRMNQVLNTDISDANAVPAGVDAPFLIRC